MYSDQLIAEVVFFTVYSMCDREVSFSVNLSVNQSPLKKDSTIGKDLSCMPFLFYYHHVPVKTILQSAKSGNDHFLA